MDKSRVAEPETTANRSEEPEVQIDDVNRLVG